MSTLFDSLLDKEFLRKLAVTLVAEEVFGTKLSAKAPFEELAAKISLLQDKATSKQRIIFKIVSSALLILLDIIEGLVIMQVYKLIATRFMNKVPEKYRCYLSLSPEMVVGIVAGVIEELSKYVAQKLNFLGTYFVIFNVVEQSLYTGNITAAYWMTGKVIEQILQNLPPEQRENVTAEEIVSHFKQAVSKMPYTKKAFEKALNKQVTQILAQARKKKLPVSKAAIRVGLAEALKKRLPPTIAHVVFSLLHKFGLSVLAMFAHIAFNVIRIYAAMKEYCG